MCIRDRSYTDTEIGKIPAAIVYRADGTTTVSYTHLDVYKRQKERMVKMEKMVRTEQTELMVLMEKMEKQVIYILNTLMMEV